MSAAWSAAALENSTAPHRFGRSQLKYSERQADVSEQKWPSALSPAEHGRLHVFSTDAEPAADRYNGIAGRFPGRNAVARQRRARSHVRSHSGEQERLLSHMARSLMSWRRRCSWSRQCTPDAPCRRSRQSIGMSCECRRLACRRRRAASGGRGCAHQPAPGW